MQFVGVIGGRVSSSRNQPQFRVKDPSEVVSEATLWSKGRQKVGKIDPLRTSATKGLTVSQTGVLTVDKGV